MYLQTVASCLFVRLFTFMEHKIKKGSEILAILLLNYKDVFRYHTNKTKNVITSFSL